MKKVILFIFFTITIYSYGYSQSLALADSAGPVANNSTITRNGHPNDSEITSYMFVKNTTSATISVKVKKVVMDTIPGSTNSFCWGLCFPPSVYVSPTPLNINSHATDSTDFAGHYTPQGFEGVSTIRYVFFNQANTSDSVCVNISYSAYPLGVFNQTAKDILSGVYPNPANNKVNFEYSLNTSEAGFIIIRNLLGTVVKSSNISNEETRLSVYTGDLPEGIYFYSMDVNGKSLITRKLIVKH